MPDAASRLATALADRYRIEREIGAGGMATVYLATDLKHGRQVAIKLLRPELGAVLGAERFLAEIRTTANLQHPNILGLIDSGSIALSDDSRLTTHDSLLYYVMPYVDGESLRARLTREKQLPVADAVRIATEVASALDYAHRRDVIHRDIKPENILLHDGRALVADFGIALAASRAGGSRMTETGMSLGTPAYMSPEQAMGQREITGRSDVYALGCVTYEMLTGDPPFTGSTMQAIIARVVTEQPRPLVQQRHTIPPNVEAAVLGAIEKLPADRFGTAREFADALNTATFTHRTPGAITATGLRPARLAAPLLATAAAAALVTWGLLRGNTAAPPLPPARLALIAPSLGGPTLSTGGRQIAITPAGDAIVYVGRHDSTTVLFLQRLDQPAPVEILGSAGLRDPIITPDARYVIGTSPSGSFRLPLEGGAPRAIALPGTNFVGAWAPDGDYWFTGVGVSGLTRLTPTDSLIPLSTWRDKQHGLRVAQILDDGHTALVVRAPAASASGPGMLFDLRTGELTPLVDGPILELRAAQGELVCALPDGTITAAPFDAQRHKVLGSAVQVATGAALGGNFLANFAVARNGTLTYVQEGPPSLVLSDMRGTTEVILPDQPAIHAPNFSPDGRRLSFDITTSEGRDVWIFSLDQHSRTRATFVKDGHDATWSPDGRSIIYTSFLSNPDHFQGIYRIRPGSTEPPETLFVSEHLNYTGTLLRDGSALITGGNDLNGHSGADVARVANGGRGPIEPLVASNYLERYATPSPDGRWLAFTSDKSGREEVYVQPRSGEGDQVQVSQDGGAEIVWAPDSRGVFYRSASTAKHLMMFAQLATAPALTVVSQRVLFPIPDIVGTGPHANFDVSPDGKTLALVRRSSNRHIVVIQDLPGLLRKLRSSAAPGL
ncbi:MAG: protein kinase [Gemmatimonadetes bacterium]|nr:protein kinase [Gemmatimonadota bacterium]